MSEAARELIPENVPEIQPEPSSELPMRWHGFLVRVYLWAAAAYHTFRGAWIFTGMVYHGAAARNAVYAALPVLRAMDYFLAAAHTAAAVLMIFARFRLAEKRRGGIRLLLGAYILPAAVTALYAVLFCCIAPLPSAAMRMGAQAAAWLALLLANRSYYRKRLAAFEPG